MNVRVVLRAISFVMLVIAVIFVFIAVSVPTFGSVIYIGKFQFGPEQWRVCFVIYAVIMIALFVGSFFVKKRN